jgi:hypothetical protein
LLAPHGVHLQVSLMQSWQVEMAGGWDAGHLNPGDTHKKHSIVMTHYNKCSALLEPLMVLAGFIKNQRYHVRGRDHASTRTVQGILFGNVMEELTAASEGHARAWQQAGTLRGETRSRARDRAQWLLAHTDHLLKLLHHFEEVLLQDLPLWQEGVEGAPAVDWVSAYVASLRPELQEKWAAHCQATVAQYAARAQTFARGAPNTGAAPLSECSLVRVSSAPCCSQSTSNILVRH